MLGGPLSSYSRRRPGTRFGGPLGGYRRATSSGPTPAEQIAALLDSYAGTMIDASDFSTLYTDSGKTTPASRGNAVYVAADQSVQGNDLIQGTAARRLIAQGRPTAIGSDLVTNGRFAADTDWTKGTGWTISGDVATKTAGAASVLSQAITVEAGKLYLICYDMTRSAGTLGVRFTGGTTVTGVANNNSRSHTEMLIAATGNTTLELFADASFAGTVSQIRVFEATAFTFDGLCSDGIDSFLSSLDVDMSGSDKLTIGCSYWRDDRTGSPSLFEVGDTTADVGSVYRVFGVTQAIRGRDASLTNVGIFPDPDDVSSNRSSRRFNEIWEIDYEQAATADQFNLFREGIEREETASGDPLTVAALPDGPISIGARSNGTSDGRFLVSRFFVRAGPLLTTGERSALSTWLNNGGTQACMLGDSTVASNQITSGQPSNTWAMAAFLPELEFGMFDLSNPGDKIADQMADFNALTDYSGLRKVYFQAGLNDINTFIGNETKTASQIIADIQAAIGTIRAAVPSNCEIYIAGLTPARAWLENGASNPALMYPAWQAVNEAIAGNGSEPITGVDGRITAHVALLDDGNGNLAAEFDHNGDGVHGNNYARWLNAGAYRAATL